MPEYGTKAAEEAQQSIESKTSAETLQALGLLFQWNAELASFYARRYQQYGMLPVSLLSCSTLADVQEVQDKFLQQLAEDYRGSAAKLSMIASEPQQHSGSSMASDYAGLLKKAQQDAAAIIDQAKAQAERILKSAEERASRKSEWPEEPSRKLA